MAKKGLWFSMPSWWVVLIAGGLCLTFSISIIRELMNSHQVAQQVRRLEDQVASESQRQGQLQDLIDYLGSPTFQEQEARLKLGLKKTGEQVIVVPPAANTNAIGSESAIESTSNSSAAPISNPVKWWNYFFSPHSTTLRTNA